jgi:succinyl-CoA synthetase beta subunit
MSWDSVSESDAMTRPSGRGKKGEVVSRQSIDDVLLVTKQHQNVSIAVYQSSTLLVEASRLTFFEDEPLSP